MLGPLHNFKFTCKKKISNDYFKDTIYKVINVCKLTNVINIKEYKNNSSGKDNSRYKMNERRNKISNILCVLGMRYLENYFIK